MLWYWTISTLLALCEGNPPLKAAEMLTTDMLFVISLKKLFYKQSSYQLF